MKPLTGNVIVVFSPELCTVGVLQLMLLMKQRLFNVMLHPTGIRRFENSEQFQNAVFVHASARS